MIELLIGIAAFAGACWAVHTMTLNSVEVGYSLARPVSPESDNTESEPMAFGEDGLLRPVTLVERDEMEAMEKAVERVSADVVTPKHIDDSDDELITP